MPSAMYTPWAVGRLMAINLVAYPDDLDKEILAEILTRRGGQGQGSRSGHRRWTFDHRCGTQVRLVCNWRGGSVDRIIRKSGACPGDRLILTKALGTGVVTTGLKRDLAAGGIVQRAVESMSHLNRVASELAQVYDVRAMTDITGFGLVGHALGDGAAQRRRLHAIDFDKIELLPGAEAYGDSRGYSRAAWRAILSISRNGWRLTVPLSPYVEGLLYDPQTSGGLLMAVAASDSADALLADLTAAAGEDCFCTGRGSRRLGQAAG